MGKKRGKKQSDARSKKRRDGKKRMNDAKKTQLRLPFGRCCRSCALQRQRPLRRLAASLIKYKHKIQTSLALKERKLQKKLTRLWPTRKSALTTLQPSEKLTRLSDRKKKRRERKM